MAIVIEQHPEPLARAVLFDQMTVVAGDPGQVAKVEGAIEGLIAVGLLTQAEGAFRATSASLRASELDLGL
jgi:hypothetical protein